MREGIMLIVGLVVGIAGALLFADSLPPEEGTAEEKLELVQRDLVQAQVRIEELGVLSGVKADTSPGRTVKDAARAIAEDVKEGRPVDLDDFFHAMKPMFRDLSPVFDRIRLKEQREHFDRMAGRLGREYDLDEQQQAALDEWMEGKAEENAARFGEIFTSERSTFADMIMAGRDEHRDDGFDEFMEQTLEGEELDKFKENRMLDRVVRVQEEADRNVTRLDNIVELDEGQKDQVFALMARGAEDFVPGMQFDGVGEGVERLAAGSSREAAIVEVLTPEQRGLFEEHQANRRAEAEAEMAEIGLALPKNWDLYDEDIF
ncbi:MAG: hypothetical protein P8J87_08750 [Verrucomicrobiales bacterium]|nr:hypothetical protein [Verrucomicrobiales bacterium]